MSADLSNIKVADLREICKRAFRITGREAASRRNLYEALERQPTAIKNKVHSECLNLTRGGHVKYSSNRRKERNKASDDIPDERPRKKARTVDIQTRDLQDHSGQVFLGEGNGADTSNPVDGVPVPNAIVNGATITDTDQHEEFMVAPDQPTVDKLLAEFIDATGNAAVRQNPCCACARELLANTISEISLDKVPNRRLLKPTTPHPSQFTIEGMVLYQKGLTRGGTSGNFCRECLSHLKEGEMPPLSLANDMWIGDVPYQLANLSLAERLMIAKGFPSAYIIKLYPKQRGAVNWEKSQFHNGLKGNVSTFKMNPAQLADVVINDEFPHSGKILSATIGVTFVGPKGVPEACMPDHLRVRRWRVRDALKWLKENNPLYADIRISEPRLNSLPEDGIPEEILSLVRYSDDVSGLNREHEGYVPEYSGAEGMCCIFYLVFSSFLPSGLYISYLRCVFISVGNTNGRLTLGN